MTFLCLNLFNNLNSLQRCQAEHDINTNSDHLDELLQNTDDILSSEHFLRR